MKSLLIDVVNADVKEVDITDFHDFYKYIDCSAFAIVGRYIGKENRWYDIFVDNCGMLKENPILSAVNMTNGAMLFGNLIITRANEDGEQIPLTQDDINYLYEYLRTAVRVEDGKLKSHPVLVDVKYSKE